VVRKIRVRWMGRKGKRGAVETRRKRAGNVFKPIIAGDFIFSLNALKTV